MNLFSLIRILLYYELFYCRYSLGARRGMGAFNNKYDVAGSFRINLVVLTIHSLFYGAIKQRTAI